MAYDRLPAIGPPLLWDPGWSDRRLVRAYLTRDDLDRQGFGLIRNAPHESPTPGGVPPEAPGSTRTHPRRAPRPPGDGACLRPHGTRGHAHDPFDPQPGDRQ